MFQLSYDSRLKWGWGFFLSLSLRHVRSKAAWGRSRWQSEYFAQLVNSSMWPHLFLTLISYSPAGRASSSWTPWKCSSMNMLASFYESERVYLHLQECMHPECIEKCSECFTLPTFCYLIALFSEFQVHFLKKKRWLFISWINLQIIRPTAKKNK